MKKAFIILTIFSLFFAVASYLSVGEIRKQEIQQRKAVEQQQSESIVVEKGEIDSTSTQIETQKKDKKCSEDTITCFDGAIMRRSLPDCDLVECKNVEIVGRNGWKTWINNDNNYSITYPPEFWPQGGHNLKNYDTKDSRYIRGNPEGVSIQIQKHSVSRMGFDTVDEYKENLKTVPDSFVSVATDVQMGEFVSLYQYTKNGPGGAFAKYMAFDEDENIVYMILVFEAGYSKNKKLVEEIISSFRIIESDSEEYAQKEGLQLSKNALRWKIYEWEGGEYFTTKDWSFYSSDKGIATKYSLEYPSEWTFSGGSVFRDENGRKIAELSPSYPILLNEKQHCYDTDFSEKDKFSELLSQDNFEIGDNNGVKRISKTLISGGGGVWYPNNFCIEDENKAFKVTFYETELNSSNQSLFNKVISTFKFID